MRTLANAGELNPGEEERPREETWALTALDRVLVERGEPYVIALEHAGLPDEERAFLEHDRARLGARGPIRFDDRVWGVLEAYSAVGAPPFTASHVRFAEALCAQVATAIGRAELFSRLESLAYEDPLTRLPNRRALDERLEEAVARALATARELALLFCDLDGLKDVNDRHGHDAGDRALLAAGRALAEAAEAFPGSFTSRLGGDEFCVLMEGYGAEAARALARDAAHRLAAEPGGPYTFSCGVACLDEEHRRSADLFRAADAAQYAAKRVGGGKLFVAEPGIPTPAIPVPEPWSRRRFRDAGPHEREALVRFLLELLDGELDGAGELARLEAVTGAFAEAFDAARWAISRRRPGAPDVETVLGAERRERYDPDVRRPLQRRGRGLRARRLPADGRGPRARRRLRDRRGRRERRRRASARCSPNGASPPSRRRPRSRRTAPPGSSSCSPTAARTRCPARCRSCGCSPPRRPGAGRRPAIRPTSRRARTSRRPPRSAAGPRRCAGPRASTPRRRPAS